MTTSSAVSASGCFRNHPVRCKRCIPAAVIRVHEVVALVETECRSRRRVRYLFVPPAFNPVVFKSWHFRPPLLRTTILSYSPLKCNLSHTNKNRLKLALQPVFVYLNRLCTTYVSSRWSFWTVFEIESYFITFVELVVNVIYY